MTTKSTYVASPAMGRKLVVGLSYNVRLKPACSATEASQKFDYPVIEAIDEMLLVIKEGVV